MYLHTVVGRWGEAAAPLHLPNRMRRRPSCLRIRPLRGKCLQTLFYRLISGRYNRARIGMIVNVAVLDVPPPGPGLTTVMLPWPPTAISAVVTVIFSCVALTKVVGRFRPFQGE